MRSIVISPEISHKLTNKHNVSRREVEQCFENKVGIYLEDEKEEHKTDPATLWFVAPTNCNRLLKVIFVFSDGNIYIKSAYDANQKSQEIYNKLGK